MSSACCYVCTDTVEEELIETFCECKGTLVAHRHCIETWIRTAKSAFCKHCKTKYKNVDLEELMKKEVDCFWRHICVSYLLFISWLFLPLVDFTRWVLGDIVGMLDDAIRLYIAVILFGMTLLNLVIFVLMLIFLQPAIALASFCMYWLF